jgi:hypothetical protein
LFDIVTSFASGEEVVGAIFDGKKGKRVDDAPAEGSKSKEPQQKHKWGKKGKKPHRDARAGARRRRGRGPRGRPDQKGPSSGPLRPRRV